MMKKKTPTNSARNARLLLTGYWGYKMINGGDFLKTTLNVLQVDRRFKEREKQRQDGETRSDQKVRKNRKSRRTSIAGSFFWGSIVKKILKAARVY